MEKIDLPSPDSRRDKEFAALSYLWIFSLVILLAKRDNPFIQHHARRGFVLFLLSILLWPFPILHYGEFLILALCLFGFITASMGNENTIPVISEIADGTIRLKHLRHYWHHTKHGVIKIVKPDHRTPSIQKELISEQEKELKMQERILGEEKRIIETDEKKLSSLYHRVNEDENRLDELADEVHHLEGEMEELKK